MLSYDAYFVFRVCYEPIRIVIILINMRVFVMDGLLLFLMFFVLLKTTQQLNQMTVQKSGLFYMSGLLRISYFGKNKL